MPNLPNHPINTLPHTETQRRIVVFREALSEMPEPVQKKFVEWRNILAKEIIEVSANMNSIESARNYADGWLAELVDKGRLIMVNRFVPSSPPLARGNTGDGGEGEWKL